MLFYICEIRTGHNKDLIKYIPFRKVNLNKNKRSTGRWTPEVFFWSPNPNPRLLCYRDSIFCFQTSIHTGRRGEG